MSATFDQARHLLKVVAEKEVSGEGLAALHESGLLTDLLEAAKGDLSAVDRTVFRHVLGLKPQERVDEPRLIVEVDYNNNSFEDMVAAGNYNWRNSDLNFQKFPVKGKGIKRFECRLFEADCSYDEGVKRIEAAGWKPAETEHLLAFGATFPKEQYKHLIAALGSSARMLGHRYVPCLNRHGEERGLGLCRWDDGWPKRWRLLAVREISGASD